MTSENQVLITPLLKRLWPTPSKEEVTASEIAAAISLIFTNSLSPVQAGALLTALHFTGLDRHAEVLAACSASMRAAAAKIDLGSLQTVIEKRGRREGNYHGGLCDIVGTGGDSHNTFNISTTASVICSSLLMIAKHGNRASTSKSGSADLLQSTKPVAPNLENITPESLARIFETSNYAFLFAPIFHPGMRFVAPIRKELGWRTIFNLLGPLSHPADFGTGLTGDDSDQTKHESLIEARVLGVAIKDIGPAYAEALRLCGARKAMIVCGDENLDELSCAGPTHCWRLVEKTTGAGSAKRVEIENFTVCPADFGFPNHPLDTVGPGKLPSENAETFIKILSGQVADDDPILHFVLINTASLLVISGLCDADSSSMGPGDDGIVITETGPGGGRWKEGVRRARWAIKHGAALKQWQNFVKATNA
jgi:anthranilate phosphoribosyltransferase